MTHEASEAETLVIHLLVGGKHTADISRHLWTDHLTSVSAQTLSRLPQKQKKTFTLHTGNTKRRILQHSRIELACNRR